MSRARAHVPRPALSPIAKDSGGGGGKPAANPIVLTELERGDFGPIERLMGTFVPKTSIEVSKDLADGQLEAGIHGHALDRVANTTDVSGAHSHMFLTPSGDIIVTEADGAHAHEIDRTFPADNIYGGRHAHRVQLDTEVAETDIDGYHQHQMQSGTTAFDGVHGHALVVDGATLESLQPHQIAALRGFQTSGPLVAQDRDVDVSASLSKSGDLYLQFGECRLKIALSRGQEVAAANFTTAGSHCLHPLEGASAEFVSERDRAICPVGEEIAKGSLEVGLLTPDQQEYFLTLPAPLGGRLVLTRMADGIGTWAIGHGGPGVPEILLSGAPGPILGMACVPKSLQQDIPPAVRWWEKSTAAEAKRARDWVTETELFTKGAAIRLVKGELRAVLVAERFYEFGVEKADENETHPLAAIAHQHPAGAPVYEADWSVGDPEAFIKECWRTPVILSLEDSPAARVALSKVARPFKLRDPLTYDRVYAASFAIERSDSVAWVNPPGVVCARKTAGEPVPVDKYADRVCARLSQVRIIRADEEEERFVYGIAMEPDTTDSHGHFQTKATIRVAAHGFMEDFGNVGHQHRKYINQKVRILETGIAMSAFNVGDEVVTEGTWFFAVRVRDDEIWADVKSGKITGFSIGGVAILDPVE